MTRRILRFVGVLIGDWIAAGLVALDDHLKGRQTPPEPEVRP